MTDAGESKHDQRRPRLDPVDITARAREGCGPDGRLVLPRQSRWPIFPFDTVGLTMTELEDPVLPEPPRRGERPGDCWTCRGDDASFVWSDEAWRVSMSNEALAVPEVVLHSREHIDFHELDDEQAAEMGVRLIRIQRALASIEGVGRVHVYKWGDGGAHLHIVLVARPVGMMQLRGMFLTTWMNALPPLDPDLWMAVRSHVRTALDASATGASPPAGA